ncbi:MAG: shikimate dehydrogenase family protein [Bacteroidaceae bacterium]|jgi:shikimate dehydrogenase
MDLYGLIGYPLKHSFSRSFFNEKFAAEKINAEYRNFEIPSIEDFMEVIESNPELRGLNVTIPYKEKVIPYLDSLDSSASEIKAVNVIKITHTKDKLHLTGYNSDIIGFTESISPLLKPHHRKALILGTGGASKAVDHGLRQLGIETLFVSRKEGKERSITYDKVTPELLKEYTVIVNTTPLGMFPIEDVCPDLPYEALGKEHLLYDLIYNPENTLFMKNGAKQGATVKNGLEMLLLQAYAAWDIWQGKK